MSDIEASDELELPRGYNIFAAVAVAAAVAALAISAPTGTGFMLIFTFAYPVIFVLGLVIGLPLYLLALRSGHPHWWMAVGAGIAVAIACALLFGFSALPQDNAWLSDIPIRIDGRATAAGLAYAALMWVSLGGTGALAGFTFWTLAVWQVSPSQKAFATAAMAALSVAGGIGMREISEDRSCHNPSRYGTNGYQYAAVFDLDVSHADWEAVEQEVVRLGREWGWSVHPDGPDNHDWVSLTMCQEPGLYISLANAPARSGLSIGIYRPGRGEQWRTPMRALHDRLRARWPNAIRYPDKYGEPLTTPPDWVVPKAPPPGAPR